ncbi:MAG: hypothetical protein LBM27_00320 [Lactobacillaceae bacterium]|jgi:hypothetical protein|nr:hypothetical protein [Lactobacillaceae bacterium]
MRNLLARLKQIKITKFKFNSLTVFYLVAGVGFLATIFIFIFAPTNQKVELSGANNPADQAKILAIGSSQSSSSDDSSATASSTEGQLENKEVLKTVKGKIQGTYLSSEQPVSDLSYLNEKGISFIYFRASVGASQVDSMYKVSTEAAKKAGIPFGAVLQYDNYVNSYSNFAEFKVAVGDTLGVLPIAVDAQSVSDDVTAQSVASLVQNLMYQYPDSKVIVRTDAQGISRIKPAINNDNVRYWLVANDIENRSSENEFIQYSMSVKIGSGIKTYQLPMSIYNGTTSDFKSITKEAKND